MQRPVLTLTALNPAVVLPESRFAQPVIVCTCCGQPIRHGEFILDFTRQTRSAGHAIAGETSAEVPASCLRRRHNVTRVTGPLLRAPVSSRRVSSPALSLSRDRLWFCR